PGQADQIARAVPVVVVKRSDQHFVEDRAFVPMRVLGGGLSVFEVFGLRLDQVAIGGGGGGVEISRRHQDATFVRRIVTRVLPTLEVLRWTQLVVPVQARQRKTGYRVFSGDSAG